jgi:hypothetical protein
MSGPLNGKDHADVIEIKLNSPEQMLNSFDPSPFHTRDLDDRASSYIIESAEEMGARGALKLVIELPATEVERELTAALPSALRYSFSYQAGSARHQLRELFRLGRLGLGIGFMVLALSVGAIRLLELVVDKGPVFVMLEQGLFILGWVAIWRPLEIFLYDWWPMKKRIELLDRLASAQVEVRARRDFGSTSAA